MAINRTKDCLGFITGKCIYTGGKGCTEREKEECFPPVCSKMNIKSFEKTGKIMCEKTNTLVDPWEVCLKCNPSSKR